MAYRTVSANASVDRLDALIRKRLQPGADKAAIDQAIWDLFGETWAVMFTDLSGFSRGVAKFGIIHFLQTIFEAERLLTPLIEDEGGILLKVEGDSYLVIFRRAERALNCAWRMQQVLAEYNVGRASEEQVLLCVGLGYGDMLRIGDTDVFGAEVNAASKLGEDTAKAGEILCTDQFKQACGAGLRWPTQELGEAPPGAKKAWKIQC